MILILSFTILLLFVFFQLLLLLLLIITSTHKIIITAFLKTIRFFVVSICIITLTIIRKCKRCSWCSLIVIIKLAALAKMSVCNYWRRRMVHVTITSDLTAEMGWIDRLRRREWLRLLVLIMAFSTKITVVVLQFPRTFSPIIVIASNLCIYWITIPSFRCLGETIIMIIIFVWFLQEGLQFIAIPSLVTMTIIELSWLIQLRRISSSLITL